MVIQSPPLQLDGEEDIMDSDREGTADTSSMRGDIPDAKCLCNFTASPLV
jgi:hypothetical protein